MWRESLLLLLGAVVSPISALSAAEGGRLRGGGLSGQASQRRAGVSAVPWDYDNEGAFWSRDGFASCAGPSQSPMNFEGVQAVAPPADPNHDPEKLFYRYEFKTTPAVFFNDGKSLAVTFQEHVGGIALGTTFPNHLHSTWALWQVAVHAPSEHMFGGHRVPLELQLYHTLWNPADADPFAMNVVPPTHTQAVLAVGFVEGTVDTSAFLDALAAGNVPTELNTEGSVNTDAPNGLDFASLFKAANQDPTVPVPVLSYNGSLTTPPCSENVRWFVRDDPLPARLATIDKFADAIQAVTGPSGNPRALQSPGLRLSQAFATVDATNLPTEEHAVAQLDPPQAGPTTQIQSDAGEDATMPVQNLTDPAGAEISADRAHCAPSSAACLLAHYEPDTISDSPDVIYTSNGALLHAQAEVKSATQNLTAALTTQGEVCGKRDKLFADVQSMQPGPEKNVQNQQLAVLNQQCEIENDKVGTQRSTKDTMEDHEGAVRGALGKAIQDAQVELNQTTAVAEDLDVRHGEIAPQGTLACYAEGRLWDPFSHNSGDTTVTIDQGHNNGSPHRAVGQPGVIAGCAIALAQKATTVQRKGTSHVSAAAGVQEKKALRASRKPRGDVVGIRKHAAGAGGAPTPPAKRKEGATSKKWI